jgi:predicted Zn-dependent peptidase
VPPRAYSGRAFQAKFAPAETAEITLQNGINVFLERDTQSPIVSIGWMVPAGHASDPPGKPGLAHLTEHLVFEAPRQDGMSAMAFYDRTGVQFRGETDLDSTQFAVTVNRERFAELLKYELARMASPLTTLAEGALRREIRILREEAASQRPRWRQEALSRLFRALFPQGVALARYPDDEAALDTLTTDDVRQFAQSHYRTHVMQLFVVGDFTWAEAQTQLGKIPMLSASTAGARTQLAAAPPTPPGRAGDKILQQRGFVAENVLHVAWPLPSHVDMVGIEPLLVPLVASVLPRIEGPSQGRYPAWMPQGPQGEKSVDLVRTRQGSALVVTAQLPPKADPAAIARKIITEVDSLASKIEENPDTFALVQFKVTQSRLRETENINDRISRLMEQHALGDVRISHEYFTALNAIRPLQAAGFSKAWLNRFLARVMLISPAESKEPAALSVTVPALRSILDLPKDPAMGASPRDLFAGSRFVWKKYDNGVEVAVLNRPKSPITTFLLGVRATKRNPNFEPIDAFVEVSRSTLPCPLSAMACADTVDATSFRSTLSLHGDNAFDASRYLLGVAAAPRHQWNSAVKDWFGPLLEKQEAMPDAIARRDLQEKMWGNHPRGKRLSNELLRRITLAEIVQWEQANIRPENTLVIAVTNQDPEALADSVGYEMQHWRAHQRPPRMPVVPPPDLSKPHPLQILYATDPALQSARFSFGCLMPPLKNLVDRSAAKMVGDWVDRLLFSQLRTQSDASYSTATRVNAYATGETSMQGMLDVSVDQIGPALALFRGLFDSSHDLDQRQIDQMKELRRRRVALQNLTGPEIASEIFDRWSFHMGNPTPLKEFDEISRVAPAQVNAVWNTCRQNAVLQVRTNQRLRVAFEK